jgi:hypothetical protein
MSHDELLSLHDDASFDGRDEASDHFRDALIATSKQAPGREAAQVAAACIGAMLLLDGDALLAAAREGQAWIREPVIKQFALLKTLFPSSAPAFNRIRLRQPVEASHFSVTELMASKPGQARIAAVGEAIWEELRARLDAPQAAGLLWSLLQLRPSHRVAKGEVKEALAQLADADLRAGEKKLYKQALKALVGESA